MTETAISAEQALKGPVTLKIYPGADASFTLYQDALDGYGYEQGEYTLTEITWDEAEKRLSKPETFNAEVIQG